MLRLLVLITSPPNGAGPGLVVKAWLFKPIKSYSARADQLPAKATQCQCPQSNPNWCPPWSWVFARLGGSSRGFCLQRNSAEPCADRFQDGDMSATYDSVHRGRLSEHRYSAAYDFVPRR